MISRQAGLPNLLSNHHTLRTRVRLALVRHAGGNPSLISSSIETNFICVLKLPSLLILGLSLPLNLYPCFQCYSKLQRSAETARAAGSIEAAPFISYNLSRSFNLDTWLRGWNEDTRSWRYVAISCCLLDIFLCGKMRIIKALSFYSKFVLACLLACLLVWADIVCAYCCWLCIISIL